MLMKQVLYAVRYDRLLPIVICDLSVSSNVKPLKASSIVVRNPKVRGSIPHRDSEFFLCLCLFNTSK